MKEIGGYLEIEKYNMPMLHDKAIALNSGRNALAYLLLAKKIQTIWIPKFLCDSVRDICIRENVAIKYYSIGVDFLPIDITSSDDEYVYIVNYYGQISNSMIKEFQKMYKNIIVDNIQAYFQDPIEGVDTIYTCRKFFGVPDGAFLYTDIKLDKDLPLDESYERMRFILGRYERTASEFYPLYVENEHLISSEPIKKMSLLTSNLLHVVDYENVKSQRTRNFEYLHDKLYNLNELNLYVPMGAYMYPLYMRNGAHIRSQLQKKKIYIPTLWSDVFVHCGEDALEYDMAKNIIPLPVDQRYNEKEMNYILEEILKCSKLENGLDEKEERSCAELINNKE